MLKSPPPEKQAMEKIHAKVHRVLDLKKVLGQKAPDAAELEKIIDIATDEVLAEISSQVKKQERQKELDRLRRFYLQNQQKGGQKC